MRTIFNLNSYVQQNIAVLISTQASPLSPSSSLSLLSSLVSFSLGIYLDSFLDDYMASAEETFVQLGLWCVHPLLYYYNRDFVHASPGGCESDPVPSDHSLKRHSFYYLSERERQLSEDAQGTLLNFLRHGQLPQ
jgi:hypothetical protein